MGAQVSAGFEQMGREAMAQRVGMNLLGQSGPRGCHTTGVPDGSYPRWVDRYRAGLRCWERGIHAAFSNANSSAVPQGSFGESGTSRSRAPLPWRTWITIRLLSMSSTLIRDASVLRSPVA